MPPTSAPAVHSKDSSQCSNPGSPEPEWASLCNSVFEQYLDDDDSLSIGALEQEGNIFDDPGPCFEFSDAMEPVDQVSASSPTFHHMANTDAEQSWSQAADDTWSKHLRLLEQNAAESAERQQKTRNVTSHPDFLSLGGFPSPPALSASSLNRTLSLQQQRGRMSANGCRASNLRSASAKDRSISRGRPRRLTKTSSFPITPDPYATIRSPSMSENRSMSPSLHNSGSQGFRADSLRSSGRPRHHSSAAMRTSSPWVLPSAHRNHMWSLPYRLWNNAHVQNPESTPSSSAGSPAASPDFDLAPWTPNNSYMEQNTSLSDFAPRSSSPSDVPTPMKNETYDIGFPDVSLEESWDGGLLTEPFPEVTSPQIFDGEDTFGYGALPDLDITNLGLDFGNNMDGTVTPKAAMLPDFVYGNDAMQFSMHGNMSTFADSSSMPPTSHPSVYSPSPSPAPNLERQESFSQRTSSTRRATSCRASRARRRAKSTQPNSRAASVEGGFVNFTPNDSNKILTGVAPSGSSKTKARREREAADKRAKLSQAAIRAIIEAGGDLESLRGWEFDVVE